MERKYTSTFKIKNSSEKDGKKMRNMITLTVGDNGRIQKHMERAKWNEENS